MKNHLTFFVSKVFTSMHFQNRFKVVSKICFTILFIAFVTSIKTNAQLWTQLGPGAGGQERAVYIYKNIAGNYVLYVGSDVSGVWRSSGINPNDLVNPNQFQYKYISNHELTRFINKFCRPTAYTSDYLFVANRSGIDRIDLKNENNPMQNVILNSEYWVSDIFICKSNPANSYKHKSYAVTGNTRIDQAETNKPLTSFDFYEFDLGQDELSFTNLKGYNILNFTSANRNVYTFLCDENNTPDPSDDNFITGTDKGIYLFNYGDLSGTNVNATYAPGPPAISGDYIVSSILKIDAGKYLITIYGVGLFLFEPSSATPWTDMISTLGVINPNPPINNCYNIANTIDDIPEIRQFTKVLLINNPSSGALEGFLLVNATSNVDLSFGQNRYVGLFYCNQSGGQPDGSWCALRANSNVNNDYGWNGSKPCSNPNGILLTDDNHIIVGKQGNIFISKDPLSSTSYTTMNWQQIYTTASAPSDACPDEEYIHSGYVNMVSNVVFPETSGRIWTTARDRLFWLDDGSGNSFSEIVPGNSNTNCYSIDLTTTNPCGVTPSSLSDAFFMRKEGNFLYAGIAEGFATNKGLGYVIKNDNTNPSNKVWTVEGNAICGDPLKFFINNGVKYVLVRPSPNAAFTETSLLYLNGSGIWTLVPNFPTTGIRDVDMITIGGVNHFFIIANSGIGSQTIYHFTGNLTNNPLLLCSKSNIIGNYNFEMLKILPFNSLTDFKVLVGSSPADPPLSNITYFHELNSGSSCTLNPVPVSGTIFQNLHLDKIDNVDEGVTSIEVNTDREIIYVATVSFDATQTVQVKSHLYKTTYTDATGVINPNWTEITGDAPNKTFTYLNSNNSTSNCNEQYVYACVRGLGAWKFEENPVLITTSNDVVCSGATNASATASNPFGGAATYLWSNLQTTQTATGLGAGTYTVTVTSTSSTCTSSATIVISEDPNCCNTYNQYLYEADFNSGNISGDWNLNESVTCAGSVNISNATISISQGVSITIPSGVTVTVDGSTLFACGNMWQGFVVEDGGTLTITNSSTIRDAQYGIHILANGNLFCYSAILEHNYVDIFVPDLQGGTVIVEGTTFSCTGCTTGNPLKGAYPGQSPTPNTVTYSGIEAYNSTFNIGVSGGVPNHFVDLYRGVTLENCYNIVLNSDFNNMISQVYYLSLGGFGIYANMSSSGFLKQVGFGEYSFSPTSFENCQTAIYSRGGSLSATGNRMINISNGIRANSVTGQNINISFNNIEATNSGITLTANEYAAYVNIGYNTVSINGSNATGIGVFETNVASSSRTFKINCNTIAVDNGAYGINLNHATRINVLQNSVSLNSTTNSSTGIALNGSQFCTIIENVVSGNTTNRHISYLASVAPYNSFINNDATLTEIGFDIRSNCTSDEQFKGNSIWDQSIGLHLNANGIIGKQTNRGNRWFGPFVQWGGQNENTVFNDVFLNPFTVHEPNPGSLFHPTNDVPVGAQWFFWDPNGVPYSASFPIICNAWIAVNNNENESKITYTDTLIVYDSIQAAQFEQELKYFTGRDLLVKLFKFDSLRNDNGIFESYYISKYNSTAGILTDIGLKLRPDLSLHQNLSSNFIQINSAMDSLILLDSLIVNGNSGVLQSHSALITSLRQLGVINSALINSSHLEIDSTYLIAKALNDAINNLNDIELYEKAVNDFHIQFHDKQINQVDSIALNNLLFISSLCPYAYGQSVYRARSELMRFNIESNWDDKYNCAVLGYLRQAQNQQTDTLPNVVQLGVFPNPSHAELFVSYPVESGLIEIMDLSGRLVLSHRVFFTNGIANLNTSTLQTGIYTISLKGNNFTSPRAKFVIIK